MSYQALLFCPDDKVARVVTQVLSELEFAVEPCNEPFAAVKKITAQHFDAVVADCENEQNATLIFKTARNSNLNQTSLAVAVVEGQSGVAKAFRIGANLVLTKPINVEQSKGTLRVARGLLRKSDAGKSTTAAANPAAPMNAVSSSPVFAKAPAAVTPAVPFKAAPVQAPTTSANSSMFEVEAEPSPKPDPTEAALFESMADPSASLKTHQSGSEVVSVSQKQYPWQPVRKQGSTEQKTQPGVAVAHAAAVTTSASPSAAAAAAPAKEKSKAPAALERAQDFSPAKKAESLKAQEQLVSGSGVHTPQSGGATKLLAIAAVIVLAAVGYFGWKTLKPAHHSSSTAVSISATPASPVQSSVTPQSEAPSVPAASQSIAAPAEAPHVMTPVPETKHSASPAADVVVAEGKSSENAKPRETIVVRSGSSPVPSGTVEQISAPPPNALAMATPNSSALPGIVSASTPSLPKAPVPQMMKVSQGLVQGLLVHKVQPVYPPQAMQTRREGAVQLQANISKDGNVTAVKVVSGDGLLARAATDAVKQWKYRPYLLNGQPIPIETQITVNFRLP